jgi:hypothetical protein
VPRLCLGRHSFGAAAPDPDQVESEEGAFETADLTQRLGLGILTGISRQPAQQRPGAIISDLLLSHIAPPGWEHITFNGNRCNRRSGPCDGPPHRCSYRPNAVRGQIMDLATKNNERFIVDRRGEPAVVIMSVQGFIRTAAPPPDWIEKAWTGAKQRGLDKLTPAEIDAEIDRRRELDL